MKTLNPKGERRFYTGMSIAILIIVFLGFFKSFYLRPLFPDNPAPSYPMVYVHGAIFSLWVILFMVQVSFIRKNRVNWHRKAGLFIGLLAIIIVVQGLDLAFSTVRAGRVDVRFGGPLPLILPVTDIVLFSSFALLGFINRLKPQRHKRWMLLATVNLINAAIGRLPGASEFGPVIPLLIFTLFVVALAVWDFKSTRKLNRVTLIGGLLTILSQPLRFMFAETAIWQVFEKWVIGIGV